MWPLPASAASCTGSALFLLRPRQAASCLAHQALVSRIPPKPFVAWDSITGHRSAAPALRAQDGCRESPGCRCPCRRATWHLRTDTPTLDSVARAECAARRRAHNALLSPRSGEAESIVKRISTAGHHSDQMKLDRVHIENPSHPLAVYALHRVPRASAKRPAAPALSQHSVSG